MADKVTDPREFRALWPSIASIPCVGDVLDELQTCQESLISRVTALRLAIRDVIEDEESQPGGWGPDVTCLARLKSALDDDDTAASDTPKYPTRAEVARLRRALNDLVAQVDAEPELDSDRFSAMWPALANARRVLEAT